MSRPLLILACSATKRDGMFAHDVYDGPAYRVLRASGWPEIGNGPDCRVCILSAEHGLIGAWHHIAPYNRKMDESRAAEFAALDTAKVRERLFLPVPETKARGAFDHYPASEIFVFGGELYRRVIQAWQERGDFGDIPVIYSRGGIGQQLGQLKAWLASKAERDEQAGAA